VGRGRISEYTEIDRQTDRQTDREEKEEKEEKESGTSHET
jgi:hypothetical protein